MKSNLMRINPKVLEWARKRARLSQDSLAGMIGVSKQRYLEWESGRSLPSAGELNRIAFHLRCPVLVFLCLGVGRALLLG
ncbi:MAG: helix-turn-helix transcriptional regulator [Syntrophorhabdales bacterium]|jgi:transcriptional regulator with XRE-family HTH domain